MDSKENYRILIVEDNSYDVRILQAVLHPKGYTTDVAKNGKDALTYLNENQPDLILLDIMMPGMDGLETCEELKKIPQLKNVPVIFLTAVASTMQLVKGFELGAVDYILKPYNAKELLTRLRTHLKLKEQTEYIHEISNNRKELIHILCHDLKNPIAAAKSCLEYIEDKSGFKEVIDTSLKNCLRVIDIVRNIRALNDRKLDLDIISFSLKTAIDDSLTILKDHFFKKNITIELNLEEDLEVDAEITSFINSVLNNILTNAVKFSAAGSKIILSAERAHEFAILSIRDFGIGMPKEILNDIFSISKATTRQGTEGELGTGFGMPLVKRFMQAYGGKIEISSLEKTKNREAHGTEVKLFLKLKDN